MASTNAEVQVRLQNNARAAKLERLRNEARKLFPELGEDEIAERAIELEREELRRAGALGAATYQRRAAEQRAFAERRDHVLALLDELSTALRGLGDVA